MVAFPLRSATLAVAATLLSGCAYGGLGYGGYGSGVSVGIGSAGYDRYCDPLGYGGSPYGYGSSRYGYGAYGGGYGYPYDRYGYGYGHRGYRYSPYGYAGYGCGWNDGFYYPGAGYYVYAPDGRRHRWTDDQRRYWEQQREQARREGRLLNRWQRHVDSRNPQLGDQGAGIQSRAVRQVEPARSSERRGGYLNRVQRRVEERQANPPPE